MGKQADDEARHHSMMAEVRKSHPLVDHLYLHLDVLDAKISVLLTFNGILFAIYALFITSDFELIKDIRADWYLPLFVSGFGVVLSTFLCLSGIEILGSHSSRGRTVDQYVELIVRTTRSRTIAYRTALFLTRICCLVVLGGFLYALFIGACPECSI